MNEWLVQIAFMDWVLHQRLSTVALFQGFKDWIMSWCNDR
jgi:hypothetical protein